ncbi:hypothetical protein WN73_11840 [Bradyrhizobium sp. CCBAU 45394]|nr:hypothetical protein [Bradyrhizobium sp. CCBAU 45394]MDA9537019.1 hypothetical protein [Bradyrhizobium sp. CCBAU 21362]
MLRQQEHVLLVGGADQPAADQRAARQVERRARFLLAQLRQRGIRIQPAPHIVLYNRQPRLLRQKLNPGLALRGDKATAQRLVPRHQPVQAALPGAAVEPTLEPPPQLNVVKGGRCWVMQLGTRPWRHCP